MFCDVRAVGSRDGSVTTGGRATLEETVDLCMLDAPRTKLIIGTTLGGYPMVGQSSVLCITRTYTVLPATS